MKTNNSNYQCLELEGCTCIEKVIYQDYEKKGLGHLVFCFCKYRLFVQDFMEEMKIFNKDKFLSSENFIKFKA